MDAYEDMVRNTSSAHAPWHVVPADNKWFTRLVVADAIVTALEKLDPQFPTVDAKTLAEMEQMRKELLAEKG
jgi:hypothetical protein